MSELKKTESLMNKLKRQYKKLVTPFGGDRRTMLSYEVPNLMPLQGEWKGTNSHGLLFTSRRGQLFNWSPFDGDSNNNVCVIGEASGAGIFIKDMMMSAQRCGGSAFVFDSKGDYKHMCLSLGGSLLSFNVNNPICINPFSAIAENDDALTAMSYEEYVDDTLSYIDLVLALLLELDDVQNKLLSLAMKITWDKYKQKTTLTKIAETLRFADSSVAKALRLKLAPYTRDGFYGQFFEGKNTLNLSNPFVVVDLEKLVSHKNLQHCVVNMLMIQIFNKMIAGDRNTPFHIMLSEILDLVSNQFTMSFWETFARKMRMYRGSLVVGVRDARDFLVNPYARVLFNYSGWLCLLPQSQKSLEALKRLGGLGEMDDDEESLIRSLGGKEKAYNEIYIKNYSGAGVGRFNLDDLSSLLYAPSKEELTKAGDAYKVNGEQEIGVDLIERGKQHV